MSEIPKREIKRLLGQDVLTSSDLVNLMSQFRIVLESQDRKHKYRYLNMYCNWALHSKLSNSAPAYEVIESIANAIVGNPNAPKSQAFFEDVTRAFLFDELRTDCINFSKEYETPSEFCTDQITWNEFLALLIAFLRERPLAFPDSSKLPRKVAPIFNRIKGKWTAAFKNTEGIKEVSFVLGEAEHQGKVLWNLKLIPGPTCVPKSATLRGPLISP